MDDTEWNDALRHHGIIPPKEPNPVEISRQYLDELTDTTINNYTSKQAQLERATLTELDELEDEEDDRVLDMYRRRRIQELKDIANRRIFGQLIHISEPEFLSQVTHASKDNWVICHLFKDSISACKLMNAILTQLANHYRETKFVKIIGDQCIHGYPDRNLPTLIIYHHGEIIRQIVGIHKFPGGLSCTYNDIEILLLHMGAIQRGSKLISMDNDKQDDDDNDDHQPSSRFSVQRIGKGYHHEQDSDSDSD